MKTFIAVIVMFVIGLAADVFAQNVLELEAGYVVPGYNDVAIPGDSGTRFSLTDGLNADETTAFRLRYGHTFSMKHWLAVLVAPLTVRSSGTLDREVDFAGTTFPESTPVDTTFRFDSYRLIYRYAFHESEKWLFGFGGALKVRDAAIKLEGGGLESEKTNTGIVPLLSFNAAYAPVEGLRLVLEGEALAAPQGRAEDVRLAAEYDVSRRLAVTAGYRILEGGADNDEVYTFSLFQYFIIGAALSF